MTKEKKNKKFKAEEATEPSGWKNTACGGKKGPIGEGTLGPEGVPC